VLIIIAASSSFFSERAMNISPYKSIFLIVYNNNLYLPSAMFIAQVLVGPSKQLKQIFQIEHGDIVKNPNWPEANQLAIYKQHQHQHNQQNK